MRGRFGFGVLIAMTLVGLSAIALHANVLLRFSPELGGGIPAYARLEIVDGEVLAHHDDQWVAITFYRQPGLVPKDFDLLGWFAPNAFDNPLTVEGFEIWLNGPWAGDVSPIQTVSYGLGAVPIWFVAWGEFQQAVADNVLTMSELEGLQTLKKGAAVHFRETLHPAQTAQQTKTQIEAWGTLQEGGSFFFQAEETHNNIKHVVIRFD